MSQFAWSVEQHGNCRYAVSYLDPLDPSRCVRMHRLVMGAGRGEVVDHINGDGLDNRRANLRVCSKAENGMNRRKQRTRAQTASRFKGVSWDKTNGIWRGTDRLAWEAAVTRQLRLRSGGRESL